MLASRYMCHRKTVRAGSALLGRCFASMSAAAEWPEDRIPGTGTGTPREQDEIISSIEQFAALPSVVYLYDDVGSDLFEEITATPEYYLTRTEFDILNNHASEMVLFRDEEQSTTTTRQFKSSLVELGAGSGQKLHPLLVALEKIPKSSQATCTYLPADYSASALAMNMQIFNGHRPNVKPLQGTHEEALQELHKRSGRKTWAYLGSSLGNYINPVPFLRNIAAHCGPRDRVLLGIDLAAHEPNKPIPVIEQAYNDKAGITAQFILNSLSVVNQIAGLDFDVEKFSLSSAYNPKTNAVEMSAECIVPCDVTDSQGELVRSFAPGDKLFIEQSGKFSEDKIQDMLRDSGLIGQRRWSDKNDYFSILELAPNLPAIATQQSNFIFKDLIGAQNLSQQPLQLRNPFAFYWGHISAFSDRMAALGLPGREHERDIFERGVDPNVDDPTQIHRHSPRFQKEWPTVPEFQEYDQQVEQGLVQKIAETGVTREILLALEHAEMHHETLMYMILQMDPKDLQNSPAIVDEESYSHPLFAAFAPSPTTTTTTSITPTERAIPPTLSVRIEATQVSLGASPQQEAAGGFVWDNELPHQPVVHVDSFHCSVFPVTNQEFSDFVQDGGYKHAEFWKDNPVNDYVRSVGGGAGSWDWIQREKMERPLFWTKEQDAKIRTLGGSVPFYEAKDWPAIVSLFEAAAYCRWLGSNDARIMTEAEYHALFAGEEDFNHVAGLGNNNWRYRGVVPVGTMEDASAKGIYDLVGNGWELTSTPFEGFEGFEPMHDYQEYSADFFDGKHFVVKGASPYTGKLVQRMSFRNWYQPNYPYPIAKFRVVQ